MSYENRFFKLARRPVGRSGPQDFEAGEAPVPPIGSNELLIKTEYVSMDPTNRIWISDAESYLPPVAVGDIMRAGGLGTVVESKHPDFHEGDTVSGLLGWQTYGVNNGEFIHKIPVLPGIPKTTFMGALGMTGATAYFGLLDIGAPREGETIVVSAATGAVGSVVCQIAKLKGLRVVGTTGSAEKCALLTNEFGVDGTINYKAEDIDTRLQALCPDGIDIYFENVGGAVLNAVLPRMNLFGRIPLCGQISTYNEDEAALYENPFRQILMKRLRVQGFIILDYMKRMPEAIAQLSKWMLEGKLKHKETIVDGFEKLPETLNLLFTGGNVGKLIVKV